jgi:hypothetical protein
MRYRSHQIYFVAHCAQEALHRAASRSGPAAIFEANIRTVNGTLSCGCEDHAVLDRRAALDDASELTIVEFVLELFQMGKAVTQKELLKLVQTNRNYRLTTGSLNAFIGHLLDQLQLCGSLPQDGT